MAAAAAAAADPPAALDPAALYGQFKEYRRALKDPFTNTAPFFSRRIIEMWSGELLTQRHRVELVDEIEIARNRYRFAELVCSVLAYDTSATSDHTALLNIVYRTRAKPDIKVLRVGYVYEEQRWRIDDITFALTRKKDEEAGAGAVLDAFECPEGVPAQP